MQYKYNRVNCVIFSLLLIVKKHKKQVKEIHEKILIEFDSIDFQ